MAPETTKTADRCETHPGSAAVARCARCDRTLCLACAVPVRGTVVGPECLPADVAADAGPTGIARAPMPRWWLATGAGLAVLVISTVLPWTRFGTGSGWFGAWGLPPRWSCLTALAAAAALLIWAVRRRPWRFVGWLVAGLCVIAAIGAGLAVVNPPPFTQAAAGPWVALVAGLATGAAAVGAARRSSA